MIGRKLINTHRSSQNSKGIALIFMAIAVAGMILVVMNPQHYSSEETGEQMVMDSTLAESIHQQQSAYSGYVVRTVIITVCIIVILLVIANIYRRRRRSDLPNSFGLSVLGKKYISTKHYLLLLKFNGRLLLVGVTDSSFTLLSNIGDDEEMFDDSISKSDNFSDLVRKYSRHRNKAKE